MNNKIILGIIGTFIAVIFLICIYEIVIADKNGPVIYFDDAEITYTEGEDVSVLLEGVTARDKKDGDVTDTLMVSNKIVLSGGDTVKIFYAAKDSKNNVTNTSRIVKYVATGKTSQNNPEEKTTTVLEESTTSQETTKKVNDPIGEIDKKSADASGIPVIKLNETEATITVGQAFDPISHVRETYDNSGDVSRRIRIDGTYDIAVPGDYKLNYFVSDTDGNVSEAAPFILHIVPAATKPANTEPISTEPVETTTMAENAQ